MQQPVGYELVRRNREIAQVRDFLQQRERELEQWKTRHSDLLARIHDLDGDLSRERSRTRSLQEMHDRSVEATALAMKEEEGRHACELKEATRTVLDQSNSHAGEVADSLTKTLQCEVDMLRTLLGNSKAVLELRSDERMAAMRSEFEREFADHIPCEKVSLMDTQMQVLRAEIDSLRNEASRAADLERKLASFVPQSDVLRMEAQVMAMCAENIGLRDEIVTLQAALELRCVESGGAAARADEQVDELERKLACCVPREEVDRAEAQVQVFRTENVKLQKEVQRVAQLERQLSTCVPCEEVLEVETQVQLLQAENVDCREEIAVLQLRRKELTEQVAMVTEEARGRRIEATMENSRLRKQLEVSRRARSTEIHALIAKMRTPGMPPHAGMPSAA